MAEPHVAFQYVYMSYYVQIVYKYIYTVYIYTYVQNVDNR